MDWLELLGGITIFIYGMHLAREGLQKRVGERLRSWLTTLTRHRLGGLLTGVLLAALLQSSNAAVGMLVGFANAGLLSLAQTMSLLLGTGIGTALVVQLLSLKLEPLALLLVVSGGALTFLGRRSPTRALGRAVLGLGFVFWGIQVMIGATVPLQGSRLLFQVLQALGTQPGLGLLVGAGLTAMVQSSAVTLGLLLSLAFAGLLTLETTLPLVLGANLGNCVLPFLAAAGSGVEGKRVAWANVLVKAAGVGGTFLLLSPFTTVVSWTAATLPRQIANAHTLFNVLNALAFLPWLPWGAKIARWLVPDPPVTQDGMFHVHYLDERSLDTPPLAFAQATREILRMAVLVQHLVADAMTVFETNDRDLREQICDQDDTVDFLEHRIKLFLTKLSREALTDEQAARELELIAFTSDLETIGDIVVIDLMHLAKKKIRKRLEFSKDGMEEIRRFHRKVLENFDLAIATFTSGDVELARTLLRHKVTLAELARDLIEAHIQRLHQGLRESIDTSSIHLDLLSNLKRINSHLSSIAHPIMAHANMQE